MSLKASQIRDIKNIEAWAKQIWYWRTHLDVFIEEYFQVRLKDVQKVEARIFGTRSSIQFVQSRGFGKTWLTALCCLAMGVLYPGSLIAVISSTAEQATLVLKKIDDYFVRNENILREIDTDGHAPVQLNRSKGICRIRNGSKIESYSIGTFRGNRAKIIVIDEAPEVKQIDIEAIAKPVRNTTRDNAIQFGFKDYSSKMVSITSACLKSNYFYDMFRDSLRRMAGVAPDQKGVPDRTCFACALDWKAAVRCGITERDFFIGEKSSMTEEKFAMEYGSIFIGAEQGAVFPYELTERCRVLEKVEFAQPAKSTAEYIIGVDLATSSAKTADNAAMCVFKMIEQENGTYIKRMVCLQTYKGQRLDSLATELRKLLIRFPNTSKVVFDHRGLGDAFPQFLSVPWVDPETDKEYPPLVMDTEKSMIHKAVPLLHPFMANITLNQQMVSYLTVGLEQGSIELPITSRRIIGNKVAKDDNETDVGTKLTLREKAIYLETDALQIEMGNIVGRPTSSGTVIYDTAKSTQHKDRYSAVGMAIHYITELEQYNRKRMINRGATQCVGIVIGL